MIVAANEALAGSGIVTNPTRKPISEFCTSGELALMVMLAGN
jgi:hypothetical protein